MFSIIAFIAFWIWAGWGCCCDCVVVRCGWLCNLWLICLLVVVFFCTIWLFLSNPCTKLDDHFFSKHILVVYPLAFGTPWCGGFLCISCILVWGDRNNWHDRTIGSCGTVSVSCWLFCSTLTSGFRRCFMLKIDFSSFVSRFRLVLLSFKLFRLLDSILCILLGWSRVLLIPFGHLRFLPECPWWRLLEFSPPRFGMCGTRFSGCLGVPLW